MAPIRICEPTSTALRQCELLHAYPCIGEWVKQRQVKNKLCYDELAPCAHEQHSQIMEMDQPGPEIAEKRLRMVIKVVDGVAVIKD